MEVSIPSLSQDRPVYYTIHVSLSGHTSYIIKRRYSEFATFCDELEREIGERSPVPFPEKKWLGNNNEEFLKDRRRRLELYIRGILKLEEWRDSLAVTKFFEISKHMRSEARNGTKENNLQSASEWAKAIAEVRTMIQQIKENTMPGGGIPGAIQSSNMIVSAEERKLQVKARSKLQELEGSLIGDNKLGEGEYMRRRNIVQELSRSLAQIDGTRRSWLVNNITGDVVDSDGYNSSASTYSNGSTGKNTLTSQLFGQNPSRPTRRVLGSGGETDRTRKLNNGGLMQMHDEEMKAQDQMVQSLRSTIQTQRSLGQQIYEELEFQNKALDDLDDDIHKTNAKLNQAKRRVKKFQ